MPAPLTSPPMLSPYRVLDLTDHRGQMAGFILAALGAEVVAVEPPGGSPARRRGPCADGPDGPSLEWWAYNRGKSSVVAHPGDLVELVRDADVVIESADIGSGPSYAELAAINPGIVHVSITPFGSTGPKAGWAATDLTLCAAGCQMALTGDTDRPPVRTTVPQAWLHASAEAAVGALLALAQRARFGLGQHVDVSAQVAIMQAGIPGVLFAPNDNPPLGRTAGGILYGPFRLQFVYPAADGHVSITLLFGDTIGPYTARLMRWVCEEGFCDTAMRDQDWNGFGTRLFVDPEAPAELERAKAAITAVDLAADQGRAVRRGPAPPAAAGPGGHAGRAGDRSPPCGPGLLGGRPRPRAGAGHLPWRLRQAVGVAVAGPRRAPDGRQRAATGPAGGRHAGAAGAASAATADPDVAPLAGLKVVDLTWVYAGPLATRVLADFGATVVKVEGPNRPDAARGGGGSLEGDLSLEGSVQFSHFSAGKLDLALDLTNPEGRDVLRDLARWADVLIESYTPGVMDAWGLGYEDLRAVNGDLVMVSTSLMGQTGPLATFAGFGNLAGAITGFYELTGWPDRSPAGPFLAYTDYVAPRLTVATLLAALDWRPGGGGQHIDFAQAEAAIHFLASAVLEHTVAGRDVSRTGNANRFSVPSGAYPAAGEDRWVAIECEHDEQWAALCDELGRPELAGLAFTERDARRDEIDRLVGEWCSTQAPEAVEARCRLARSPPTRCRTAPSAGPTHSWPTGAIGSRWRTRSTNGSSSRTPASRRRARRAARAGAARPWASTTPRS